MNFDDDDEEIKEEEFGTEVGMRLKEGEEGKALLLGTFSGQDFKSVCEEHIEELRGLADTFGIETVAKMVVPLRKVDASTYIHHGKLEEVLHEVQRLGANLVIFDDEISPAQQRNLEKALKVAVMDRTELILEIFGQRAQTKEAQLQIELAKIKYQFPRLKRLWSHFSRQRASGGFLKGEGEKQLEIDKRLLKKQVEKLQAELKAVKKYRHTQRVLRERSGIPTFAIVGYTNAGKSTLLNALTQADVLVEDKLFATLDPTTRKFTLPNNQEILLTDTVGFIRKLPHTLVAAFRSTLESALYDDVLLLLVDASHPMADEHLQTSLDLIKKLNTEKDSKEESMIIVLNKVDQCQDRQKINNLRLKYVKTVEISAASRLGFDDLMDMMIRELKKRRVTLDLKIPQSDYELVSLLRREGKILFEEYEENDILLKAEVPVVIAHKFEKYQISVL